MNILNVQNVIILSVSVLKLADQMYGCPSP